MTRVKFVCLEPTTVDTVVTSDHRQESTIARIALTVALSLIAAPPVAAFSFASLAVQHDAQRLAENLPAVGMSGPDARIILAQADVWEELIRLDVGDLADRDTRPVGNDQRMQGVRVCAEENTIRIRRAEVMLDNNRWQRLFVPLALEPG